jgi:hypothetical protein
MLFPHLILLNLVSFGRRILLYKVRNRLDVVERDGLRLALPTLQLATQKLASVQQAQGTQ